MPFAEIDSERVRQPSYKEKEQTMVNKKRLLLAVDGSERALQTVRYACEVEAFREMEVVLYHVFNSIPESYYDIEREPKSVKAVRHVRAWETEQRKIIRRYMDDARKVLTDGGHSPEAVSINIHDRRRGVARDIIAEAREGYHAALIRRRGAGALKNMILGSVTGKLIEKLNFIPLLIAGQKPVNKKLLLAIDDSPCSNRAVAFVANTFGAETDVRIRLLHVHRNENGLFPAPPVNETGELPPMFTVARNMLVGAGIAPENISEKTITGAVSRAGAIVKAAEEGGWGTIVVGRRGLSRVSDFFIGRVSNKVVYAGRKETVWIVN
jgi:nucleotide-binding universal stress UspA family protein